MYGTLHNSDTLGQSLGFTQEQTKLIKYRGVWNATLNDQSHNVDWEGNSWSADFDEIISQVLRRTSSLEPTDAQKAVWKIEVRPFRLGVDHMHNQAYEQAPSPVSGSPEDSPEIHTGVMNQSNSESVLDITQALIAEAAPLNENDPINEEDEEVFRTANNSPTFQCVSVYMFPHKLLMFEIGIYWIMSEPLWVVCRPPPSPELRAHLLPLRIQ